MLGHVIVQPFSASVAQYHNQQLQTWLDFVEISKFKAFVELTVSESVRDGCRNLLTVRIVLFLQVIVPPPPVCWSWWHEAQHLGGRILL